MHLAWYKSVCHFAKVKLSLVSIWVLQHWWFPPTHSQISRYNCVSGRTADWYAAKAPECRSLLLATKRRPARFLGNLGDDAGGRRGGWTNQILQISYPLRACIQLWGGRLCSERHFIPYLTYAASLWSHPMLSNVNWSCCLWDSEFSTSLWPLCHCTLEHITALSQYPLVTCVQSWGNFFPDTQSVWFCVPDCRHRAKWMTHLVMIHWQWMYATSMLLPNVSKQNGLPWVLWIWHPQRYRLLALCKTLDYLNWQVKFNLDTETNNPLDVGIYHLKEANSLVEEFMLLANITVSTYFDMCVLSKY